MDWYLNVTGLVIFIGTLALFTAILALFAKRLWEDARILQRAYIAVEPRGIHLIENGSDLVGYVGIKNAGRLPARRLSWFINIRFGHSGEERDDFFPLEVGKGNIVIAPGAVAMRSSELSVKVRELNEFSGIGRDRVRPTYLYVWGAIEYDDGFNIIRTSKFCHRYNWINRKQRDKLYEVDAADARYHEYGNDAD